MFCISGHADIRETETLHKEHATITAKASGRVINLSATVRPVMTYLLFIEFIALTYLLAVGWIDNDMYSLIWSNEIQAVWSAVVSFWFGSPTDRGFVNAYDTCCICLVQPCFH